MLSVLATAIIMPLALLSACSTVGHNKDVTGLKVVSFILVYVCVIRENTLFET